VVKKQDRVDVVSLAPSPLCMKILYKDVARVESGPDAEGETFSHEDLMGTERSAALHPSTRAFLGHACSVSLLSHLLVIFHLIQIELNIPESFVGVIVRILVLQDVVNSLHPWRVTGDAGRSRILVNPDIVKSHGCRHQRAQTSEIQQGETVRHPKVHDQSHGLHGNDPLADITIWSDRSTVYLPSRLVPNEPIDLAICSRNVLECVLLVTFAVEPFVIQVANPRQGLLVRSTSVTVH